MDTIRMIRQPIRPTGRPAHRCRTPRQEIYPGLLGNQIYIVGGFDGSGSMRDVAEVFDPPTNSWSSIASLPEARHHIGMVGVGGKMYGIGGADDPGFGAVDTNEGFVFP